MDAWLTDGDALRSLDFEELQLRLAPLINKYSRWVIPGNSREDLEQEIKLVIWRCQQSFDPSRIKGHEGKASGFINFVIHAIENKFGKLRGREQKFYAPVIALQCIGCGTQVAPKARAVCACGSRRWLNIRDTRVGALVSVEEMLHEPEAGFMFDDEATVFDGMSPRLLGVSRRLLGGYDISSDERKELRRELKRKGATR